MTYSRKPFSAKDVFFVAIFAFFQKLSDANNESILYLLSAYGIFGADFFIVEVLVIFLDGILKSHLYFWNVFNEFICYTIDF